MDLNNYNAFGKQGATNITGWTFPGTTKGVNTGNKTLDEFLYPFGHYNDPALPTRSGPATQASGIGLDSKLAETLGQIGSKQRGNIGNVYSGMRSQLGGGAGPRTIAPGSYADQRLGTGEALSGSNLSSSLNNVLGNEGYSDWKNQRDFGENMDIAKYTGELNKPTTLQQVLGGLGGAAQIGGQFSQNSKKKKSYSNPFSDTAGSDYGYSPSEQYV